MDITYNISHNITNNATYNVTGFLSTWIATLPNNTFPFSTTIIPSTSVGHEIEPYNTVEMARYIVLGCFGICVLIMFLFIANCCHKRFVSQKEELYSSLYLDKTYRINIPNKSDSNMNNTKKEYVNYPRINSVSEMQTNDKKGIDLTITTVTEPTPKGDDNDQKYDNDDKNDDNDSEYEQKTVIEETKDVNIDINDNDINQNNIKDIPPKIEHVITNYIVTNRRKSELEMSVIQFIVDDDDSSSNDELLALKDWVGGELEKTPNPT